jgi:uncharacterized protein (TIGR00725 family)
MPDHRDIPVAGVGAGDLDHRKRPIAVVGAANAKDDTEVAKKQFDEACDTAYQLGRNLASRGHYIICGGRFGVMQAACKGCMEVGGVSIGVLPKNDLRTANPYCTIIIPTVLGNHTDDYTRNRNSVIVAGALCMFAIGGGDGTQAWAYESTKNFRPS